MSLGARIALAKAEPLLLRRLETLQTRLEAGEDVWGPFCDALRTLAALAPAASPGAAGELLTTEQAAARFGVSAKTLLRRKAKGEIRPVIERGKFIRWSGQERLG